MENVINYIKENENTYIEELKEFLRIPSISTSQENREDIKHAAEFVAQKLTSAR